ATCTARARERSQRRRRSRERDAGEPRRRRGGSFQQPGFAEQTARPEEQHQRHANEDDELRQLWGGEGRQPDDLADQQPPDTPAPTPTPTTTSSVAVATPIAARAPGTARESTPARPASPVPIPNTRNQMRPTSKPSARTIIGSRDPARITRPMLVFSRNSQRAT